MADVDNRIAPNEARPVVIEQRKLHGSLRYVECRNVLREQAPIAQSLKACCGDASSWTMRLSRRRVFTLSAGVLKRSFVKRRVKCNTGQASSRLTKSWQTPPPLMPPSP